MSWRQSCVRALLLLIAALSTTHPAFAHPVAQGRMQVELGDTAVTVRARVALEQAIIANAFRTDGPAAETTASMLKTHGDYLVQHIRVLANGERLAGRVVELPMAPGADMQSVSYTLVYTLPPVALRSTQLPELIIQQDVLNEIEFAPGNRWEATYLLRVIGVTGAAQSLRLLTSETALVLRAAGTSPTNAQRPHAAATRAPAATAPAHAAPTHRPSALHTRTDATLSTVSAPPVQANNLLLLRDYLRFGVLHILTGYDHLLFIAALVLATVTLWDLIKIVSVFTVAHSLTLTLSVLNILRLSEQIVEPIIAISIVLVALDNLLRPASSRNNGRLAIAFAFGLFHGLGFAGGLLEAMQDLGGATVAMAIIAFSIGVELGHQVVVLTLFGLLALSRRHLSIPRNDRSAVQALALRYGSGAILCAGAVYLYAALRMT